jgi:hypothetical protein
MGKPGTDLGRRNFLACAAMGAVGYLVTQGRSAIAEPGRTIKLFDGKTLHGWIQAENSETSISGGDITDPSALAMSIVSKRNPIAAFVNGQLDGAARAELEDSASSNFALNAAARSALAKGLTKIIAGPLIYDRNRFHGVHLRPETRRLLKRNPQGKDLIALNRMLFCDAFPAAIAEVRPGWTVKNGAMASTGSGRGVIYTVKDFSRFRLMFTMRHVSGNPDHQACVLIFCTRPAPNSVPLDALGGIQFQVPKGGHWDYRPGHNNSGDGEFMLVSKVSFDPHEWSRVEILADASTGAARMAVAQPVGSKAVEVLSFHDPSAGKTGPIAWQMHNAGLFDEYKDVTMEVDPNNFNLVSID